MTTRSARPAAIAPPAVQRDGAAATPVLARAEGPFAMTTTVTGLESAEVPARTFMVNFVPAVADDGTLTPNDRCPPLPTVRVVVLDETKVTSGVPLMAAGVPSG